MILKDDFYTITSLQQDAGNIHALLELNRQHAIFGGHFPGQPVVPGVCMVQIVKEILETGTGFSLQLKAADHIKFLSMVDPRETGSLQAAVIYSMEEGEIKATATLTKNETVCLKMKAVFVMGSER
ncbi:MAG: 3-hydroxyacyl-ACP dehydratase [Chitinophagaceae bacterium]|nr:3-hydroxyacyl-ACP dehydratase [Chitinophagaceae bacterium]